MKVIFIISTIYLICFFGSLIFAQEKKPESDEDLKSLLSPLQYQVTQKGATEPSFRNEYWNNMAEGIYVDIIDGSPLFSSTDKYKSGTGWPSFTQPITSDNIVEKEDRSFFMLRTKILSKSSNSSLGHVFTDGPQDKGGLRYCMNSAALLFIPKEQMADSGYEEFLYLFDN